MATSSPGEGASAPTGDESAELLALLSALKSGELDKGIMAVKHRQRRLDWARLPKRLIMIRHGQSEGNVDNSIYSTKGDAQLELSDLGVRQGEAAGAKLRDLIGDDRVCIFVSPFERAQQTLLSLYRGGFPEHQVGMLRIDPRIREKEFGNFQTAGTMASLRIEERVVGRFYYRLPNAESCADVQDRVASFWESYVNNAMVSSGVEDFDTCLLVTHGLTIRLLLMEILRWTVRTFESVWNPGNCDYWTLRKNMDKLCYELCPEESCPPVAPWSTLEIWIQLKRLEPKEETERRVQELEGLPAEVKSQPGIARELDKVQLQKVRECSKPYTVVNYMTLPKPTGPTTTTTLYTEALLERLVDGHRLPGMSHADWLARAGKTGVTPADVHSIDWFGDLLSYRGKMLRSRSR